MESIITLEIKEIRVQDTKIYEIIQMEDSRQDIDQNKNQITEPQNKKDDADLNIDKDINIDKHINDEKDKKSIIDLFQTVWKIGPTDANKYYNQGCRSLKDLQNNPNLTNNQKIGLKYYEELRKKVPRGIITEYLMRLREIASPYTVEAVGSYRRENVLCGDIDILIYNDEDNVELEALKEKMLTNDLLIEVMCTGSKKLMGLAKIIHNNEIIVCHVDINVTSKAHLPFALLTHTGNMVFNIQMRQLAQKKGMKLSQYGFSNVHEEETGNSEDQPRSHRPSSHPSDTKVTEEAIKCDIKSDIKSEIKSEKDIFEVLGVSYILPNQRSEKNYPSLISPPTIFEPSFQNPYLQNSRIERVEGKETIFYRLVRL